MALSVSGFPEPLRQLPDPDVESSILANNPRLRGFFGKKSDSRSPTRQNTEEFQYNLPSPPSSTPRSSHVPSPSSDEQAFLVQMAAMQTPEPLPTISQRQRQISLTRRTPPPPPVRRRSSVGRLDIGMGPRAPASGPSLHASPKPPTVVVQEWSTRNTEPTLALPRPLPAVPNPGPIVESSKSAALRNMNTQQKPPSSKVLMTSPARPRAQTTAPPSVNIRYQPMVTAVVTDTTEKAAHPCPPLPAASSAASPTTLPSPGGHVRPLPRIPPATTTSTSPPAQLPRHVPRPARTKRPRTSPSSGDGFSPNIRSQFDAVPSSWASRPVDLNPSQPAQSAQSTSSSSHAGPSNHANTSAHASSSSQAGPSNYAGPSTRPAPPRTRTRSHSRPRRDHSSDTTPSGSRTPTGTSTPNSRRRPAHRVTSPSPIIPTSAITPPPSARNSASIRASTYHVTVKSSYSPTSSPKLASAPASTNRFLSDRGGGITAPPSKIAEEKPGAADALSIHDGSLHSHPMGRFSSDEPPSPIRANGSPESAVEVFVDDEDYSAVLSRSPSPMRYARPSSRGSLSDDSFTETRSRSRAIRDQLRSFRKSYRGPKSPSRSPSPIRYARRSSLDGLDEPATSISPKRRMQPRSYQFDYKAAQDSSPFIRTVTTISTEGKAGSNKSKTRSRRGQSKGSGESRPSRSTSPRRSRVGTPSESVIDISLPVTLASSYRDLVKKGQSHSSNENIMFSTFETSTRPFENATTASWNKAVESWGAREEKQWVYKDDNAVVVTTIQPSRDVWKQEEVKRVIPKLRHLRVRN